MTVLPQLERDLLAAHARRSTTGKPSGWYVEATRLVSGVRRPLAGALSGVAVLLAVVVAGLTLVVLHRGQAPATRARRPSHSRSPMPPRARGSRHSGRAGRLRGAATCPPAQSA